MAIDLTGGMPVEHEYFHSMSSGTRAETVILESLYSRDTAAELIGVD